MNINATSSFSNIQQINKDYSAEQPVEVKQDNSSPQATGDKVSLGGADKEVGVHKKWTVLHYGAGDNNLTDCLFADVNEMEIVGSDENAHIISMLDQSFSDCKTYYITQDKQNTQDKKTKLNSPVVQNNGFDVNMSDPKVLADFISWGIKNYPSEHVGVIVSSHGGGPEGAIADDKNSIDGSLMSPQDLRQAFEEAEAKTGKKIDVLGFDACLMANTEVAYELKDVADYIVASEEIEGGNGWAYNEILQKLKPSKLSSIVGKLTNKPAEVNPEGFAKSIVKNASKHRSDLFTLSAIDTSKMDKLANSIDEFAKSIKSFTDEKDLIGKEQLSIIRHKTKTFMANDLIDLYDFCKLVVKNDDLKDDNLKAKAKDVIANLKETVIADSNWRKLYKKAHGLQIEMPFLGKPIEGYEELQFAKDTNWDEALNSMNS